MPRTPNDQRNDAKNPNNAENKMGRDNRADQMNTNNKSSKSGRR